MPPVGQNPLGLGFGQSLPGYGGKYILVTITASGDDLDPEVFYLPDPDPVRF